MTIRTAVLEARFLLGDRKLYDEFVARFDKEVVPGTTAEFVAAKLAEREERHRRAGRSRYLIDTAVYRAGDQVGAWSYALIGFFGWGIKEAGVIAIVLSALWLANSLWLGKRQETLAEQQARAERSNAEAVATA